MKTKLTNLPNKLVFISKLKYKLIFIFLFLSTSTIFAQTCAADFDVLKGRKSRSTTAIGTYYKMIITNKGTSNDVYTLSSSNINGTCSNSDNSSTSNNVILNVTFTDNNLNPITSISVNSGETLTFLVHVTIPIGTPIDRWSCSQINASSSICSSYKVTTTIHTLLINSNDN